MKRASVLLVVVLAGCGDPSADPRLGGVGGSGGGDTGTQVGELVLCDEVEFVVRGEDSVVRYLKAVYSGVEEGTALFTFCDFWHLDNGSPSESTGDCTESRDPFPGFYRDGDLHVVCSVLDVSGASSLETGAGRIYIRFDGE